MTDLRLQLTAVPYSGVGMLQIFRTSHLGRVQKFSKVVSVLKMV